MISGQGTVRGESELCVNYVSIDEGFLERAYTRDLKIRPKGEIWCVATLQPQIIRLASPHAGSCFSVALRSGWLLG